MFHSVLIKKYNFELHVKIFYKTTFKFMNKKIQKIIVSNIKNTRINLTCYQKICFIK